MNNINKNENSLIDIQLYATIILIISLFISLLLTYNEKLKLSNQESIFDDETEKYLILINRITFLIVSFGFLYSSYINKEMAYIKKESTDSFDLQILASLLTTIAAILALYSLFVSNNESIIADIKNPNL
ncbi:MAG: hypothetical protein PHN42_00015 [Bacilli bacterium]|nr:hypothetical protein [Bacilli bacterium]